MPCISTTVRREFLQHVQQRGPDDVEVLGIAGYAGGYPQRLDQLPLRIVSLVVEVVEGIG